MRISKNLFDTHFHKQIHSCFASSNRNELMTLSHFIVFHNRGMWSAKVASSTDRLTQIQFVIREFSLRFVIVDETRYY